MTIAITAILWRTTWFASLHEQFKTKICLAQEMITSAIAHDIPFKTVLIDSWYLSEDLVEAHSEKRAG